jgi:uncharacterized protein YndB with AHSA1/START domain
MEINRNAPATAEGELRIDADPETVFAVISAIDNRQDHWHQGRARVPVPGQ